MRKLNKIMAICLGVIVAIVLAVSPFFLARSVNNVAAAQDLQELVTEVQGLNDADYEWDSWEAIMEAYLEAEEILSDNAATDEEKENAYTLLSNAMNNAVKIPKASEQELQELRDLIEDVKKLNDADYTEEAWIALMDAYLDAEEMLQGGHVTKEKFDSIHKSLVDTKNNMAEAAPVNKKLLEELVAEIEALNEEEYTDETWLTLINLFFEAEVVFADNSVVQSDVDIIYTKLVSAKDALVIKMFEEPADRVELEKLVAGMQDLRIELYVAESWENAMGRLIEAEVLLENADATQEEIDTAYTALLTAKNNMVRNSRADTTKLLKIVAEIDLMDGDEYILELWATVIDVQVEAETLLEDVNATQEEVDSLYLKLQKAKDDLRKEVPVDKKSLEKLLEEIESLTDAEYTLETWTTVAYAYIEAMGIMDNTEVTQQEVDAAHAKLLAAKNKLVKEVLVNKEALEKLVAEVDTLIDAEYTAETWDAVMDVYAEANAVLEDEYATQKETDDAVAELQTKKNGLVKKTPADKEPLKKLMADVESLEYKEYTQETWDVFASAYIDAVAVLDENYATQQEVDNAKTALLQAKNSLVKRPQINKEALKKLFDSVPKLNDAAYTFETWHVVAEAHLMAESVLLDDGVTQEEVDESCAELQAAIDGLVEAVLINREPLEKLMAEVELLNYVEYTPETWDVVTELYLEAGEILIEEDVTQKKIDSVYEALLKAKSDLKKRPPLEKEALKKLVAEVKLLKDVEYTQETWVVLAEALVESEIALTDDTLLQKDIDDMYTVLLTAKNNLVESLWVNTEELEKLIVEFESLMEEEYTPSTWRKAFDMYEKAGEALFNENSTQQEIDNAYTNLLKAKNALVKRTPANKKKLEKLVADIGKLNMEDYVIESWEDVMNACIEAEMILSEKNAAQEEVDDAYAKLLSAKNALVLAPEIVELHKKYLRGYPNGNFGPTDNMTRAEVAVMFYNLISNKKDLPTKSFKDVSEGQWYSKAVHALAGLGTIKGYGDGTFQPNRKIARAEFVQMAVNFMEVENSSVAPSFGDVKSGTWYYKALRTAVGLGWINGYGDNTFRPQNLISRAEAVKVTNRMMGRKADKRFVDSNISKMKKFPDVDKNYWAFYDIMEATNDHNCVVKNDKEVWKKLP